MAFINPTQDEICRMLRATRTIAVVGLSLKPERTSFRVAQSMQNHGYRIVPVHMLAREILGQTVYTGLAHIPLKVDMADVFRAPKYVPAIVKSCIVLGIQRLWLQDGIICEAAARCAMYAGITVAMDRCMWRDYSLLCTQMP